MKNPFTGMFSRRQDAWLGLMVILPLLLLSIQSCGTGSEAHVDLLLQKDFGLEKPASDTMPENDTKKSGPMVLPVQNISARVKSLRVNLLIGKKYKLIKDAPFQLRLESENSEVLNLYENNITKPGKEFIIPVFVQEGKTMLRVRARIYYCTTSDDGQCFIRKMDTASPVIVSPEGSDVFTVDLDFR